VRVDDARRVWRAIQRHLWKIDSAQRATLSARESTNKLESSNHQQQQHKSVDKNAYFGEKTDQFLAQLVANCRLRFLKYVCKSSMIRTTTHTHTHKQMNKCTSVEPPMCGVKIVLGHPCNTVVNGAFFTRGSLSIINDQYFRSVYRTIKYHPG
jgi:uncharacterized Zn-finger protein